MEQQVAGTMVFDPDEGRSTNGADEVIDAGTIDVSTDGVRSPFVTYDVESADVVRHGFSFTGSGSEYFRIWIVNVLLSIVTLYVYSAWAKVRTNRYFHGNTVLDGAAFEYHARPLQILAGRIVAVLLFALVTFGGAIHPAVGGVATLVLFAVLPWAVWRSTMFNARMTSYRNVRFGFRGELGRMYLYLLVLPLMPLVVAGLTAGVLAGAGVIDAGGVFAVIVAGILLFYMLVPWVHCMLAEYLADRYRYGRAPFAARLSTTRFYAVYIQALALATALSLGVAAAAFLVAWGTGLVDGDTALATLSTMNGGTADERTTVFFPLPVLALFPLLLLTSYFVSAFFQGRIRNHLHDRIVVDGRVRFESTVRTWPLWRLLVGNLVLLVVTLGFAWPWTRVRLARFFAERTAVLSTGALHAIVDDERATQNAFGEELGDAFDMDVDVGF